MTVLLPLLAAAAAAPAVSPPPPVSPVPPSYHAVGGWRPSWRLDIAGGTLRFQRGRTELTIPAPVPSIHYNGLEWTAEGAFGGIKVEQWHERCLGAKRRPYGDTVKVTLNKRKLFGCGGPPLPNGQTDALDGSHWRLRSVDRQPIGKEADVTLAFSRGRVIGRDGCNAFGATYTLTPATLHFDTAISTEVGCPPGTKAVERAVYALLGQTMSVKVRSSQLILVSGDRRVARFRLQDPRKFASEVGWRRRPLAR